jgi:hypothetical protein
MCINTAGTLDGSLELTSSSGSSFTLTADEFSFEDPDGNGVTTDGTVSSTLSGSLASLSFDEYTGTISEGTDSVSVTMNGDLELDLSTDELTGTLELDFSGDVSVTVTCTFTALNVSTATSADYQNSCDF